MKATIKYSQAPNYVTVRDVNPVTEEVRETEYFAPAAGGYVKINDGNLYPQTCDGLSSRGATLSWKPANGSFIDLIRREHKRGRERVLRAFAKHS